MTTPTADRLARMRQNYATAMHRAERATYYGDRAGAIIAAADARRIMRAAIAATREHTATWSAER